ncbi:hypothetical protein CL622_04085 [archaeon]|nr:hypothetical protein [archaeon]|tara:strand:+ start:288 stop:491 length:204 start_codon:yes stop_codon:yes gene_type:complete
MAKKFIVPNDLFYMNGALIEEVGSNTATYQQCEVSDEWFEANKHTLGTEKVDYNMMIADGDDFIIEC